MGFYQCARSKSKQGKLEKLLIGQKMDLLGLAEAWLLPGEGLRVKGYKWVGAAREG